MIGLLKSSSENPTARNKARFGDLSGPLVETMLFLFIITTLISVGLAEFLPNELFPILTG
ncbi:hypothetical protein, partial [Acidithiobacillus caldus]|uniref:hypothetical protein n=1 Tax=Acidithiobacillus caldus TaxID=33059 RepID=UPI001C06AE4A